MTSAGLMKWMLQEPWGAFLEEVIARHFEPAMYTFDLEFAEIDDALGGRSCSTATARTPALRPTWNVSWCTRSWTAVPCDAERTRPRARRSDTAGGSEDGQEPRQGGGVA